LPERLLATVFDCFANSAAERIQQGVNKMATKMTKTREIQKFIVWMVLLILAIVALLVSGCSAPASGPQITTQETHEPFSARAESEDGAIVAWSGYTEGYQSGVEAEFDITIKNETDQTWRGRYCLQLLDGQLPMVITTLDQREFTLQRGMGFSDDITVRFPEGLDKGAYGLSLAVRRPADPMVDLVSIQIGETDQTRRATTHQDMDASLETCPPVEGATGESEHLVGLAKADLAQRLGIDLDEIAVQSVEGTEFPDASLGVPEPGKMYAQVVTPGYVIELSVERQLYLYHGSGERVVAVPSNDEVQPSTGHIIIEGVQTSSEQVLVRGRSTLPDGICLGIELWADGELQAWWPGDSCVPVENGTWHMIVPLGTDQHPTDLDRSAQYLLKVHQQNGVNAETVFAFDLLGPPTIESTD
jgi:hypothetical protein